jgi:DinB family protein
MGARAEQLANQFSAANEELIAVLERVSPEQWRQRTLDEGELRGVGTIAHHVAGGHERIGQRVAAFAHGTPVPARSPELFDQRNAEHARTNPNPDQRATIDLLRQNGSKVAEMIRRLSDAQLDQTSTEGPGEPTMTTAEVIEQRQIAHVRAHLASIRTIFEG